MGLQYSDTLRNNQLDQAEATLGTSAKLRILTGSAPANVAAAETGTLLAEIVCPSDFMNAAASAAKTKLGTWSVAAAAGSGATPVYFRFTTSGGTAHIQGTCGIGSGDLSFDGTITAGQTVTVNTFTINAGNA
jgi:hypothetical protein